MKTPIFDFVKQYAASDIARFHMPGHKGIPSALGCEPFDITEVEGADVLYSPCGIFGSCLKAIGPPRIDSFFIRIKMAEGVYKANLL